MGILLFVDSNILSYVLRILCYNLNKIASSTIIFQKPKSYTPFTLYF